MLSHREKEIGTCPQLTGRGGKTPASNGSYCHCMLSAKTIRITRGQQRALRTGDSQKQDLSIPVSVNRKGLILHQEWEVTLETHQPIHSQDSLLRILLSLLWVSLSWLTDVRGCGLLCTDVRGCGLCIAVQTHFCFCNFSCACH